MYRAVVNLHINAHHTMTIKHILSIFSNDACCTGKQQTFPLNNLLYSIAFFLHLSKTIRINIDILKTNIESNWIH